MSLLSRYLYRTYLPVFAVCLGIFIFVLLMNYFLRLLNLALMKGISLGWIFICFSRLLPYFLSLALPMAFLVALLLTLGQLSESGEIMALRSAGFSFREMLTPYFVLAASLSAALLYVNHKASPEGFHSFKKSYSRAMSSISRVSLEAKTFLALGEWQLYAEQADRRTGRLSGIRLVKWHGAYRRLRVLAPEGTVEVLPGRGISLRLSGGTLLWPNENPNEHTEAAFGRYDMFLPFVDAAADEREPELPELNTFRLKERLRDPALTPQSRREYTTEAALRSAGAAAPIVLFLAACPLGLRLEKRSRALGFAWSLLLMFGYYGLMAVGIGIGRRSLAFSPWGPWLPDAACLALGTGLWWRMAGR